MEEYQKISVPNFNINAFLSRGFSVFIYDENELKSFSDFVRTEHSLTPIPCNYFPVFLQVRDGDITRRHNLAPDIKIAYSWDKNYCDVDYGDQDFSLFDSILGA